MDRDNYLTVAEISRTTGIGLRSLWRYLGRPGMHRYRRVMPGKRRSLYHVHVIPKLREQHLRGVIRSGRRLERTR